MKSLFLALLMLCSSTAMAGLVRVSEDTLGDGNFAVRGFIETFDESSSSAASLYSYNAPCGVSYSGTVFAPELDKTVLAVIDTSEGRTVFVVHDIPDLALPCPYQSGDTTGGLSDNRYILAFDPNGMDCLVKDDTGEASVGCFPGTTGVRLRHQWVPSRTDGLVLGTLEGAWQLDMSYIAVTNIGEVMAKGADGYNIEGMTPGNTIRLDNVIEVAIDIKFCSDPNAFNCKKGGVLPVTIFGNDIFDGHDIDVSSLQLCSTDGGCVGPPVDYSVADRGTPPGDLGAAQCAINPDTGEEEDFLNKDFIDDLDAAFDAKDVQEMLSEFCSGPKGGVSSTLYVTGTTVDGIPFISVPLGNAGVDQLVKVSK